MMLLRVWWGVSDILSVHILKLAMHFNWYKREQSAPTESVRSNHSHSTSLTRQSSSTASGQYQAKLQFISRGNQHLPPV